MTKINTLLFVLLISLTAYQIIKYQSNSTLYEQQIRLSGDKEIEQQFSYLRRQLEGIQQQLSTLYVDDNTNKLIAGDDEMLFEVRREIAELTSQIGNVKQLLSGINSADTTMYVAANDISMIDKDRTEKNIAGNAMVDNYIDNGVMNGGEFIRLNQHFSQMDPDQRSRALQRLVTAINQQKIDIDPNTLP